MQQGPSLEYELIARHTGEAMMFIDYDPARPKPEQKPTLVMMENRATLTLGGTKYTLPMFMDNVRAFQTPMKSLIVAELDDNVVPMRVYGVTCEHID